MTKVSPEQLMILAEEGPLLDNVEASLRDLNQDAPANALQKLQQDAGIQLEKEFKKTDISEPGPGIQTSQLRRDYEEVTTTRILNTLNSCLPYLDGDLKQQFSTLINDFKIETPPLEIKPISQTMKL